jgi:hypothetical protein
VQDTPACNALYHSMKYMYFCILSVEDIFHKVNDSSTSNVILLQAFLSLANSILTGK